MDYKEVYKIRKKKVGKKKARYSSEAYRKSVYVKEFLDNSLKNKILRLWESEFEFELLEKDSFNKGYKVNDVYIQLDMNKNNINNKKSYISKGIVGKITSEYDREILMKATELYGIKIDKNMYYVISKG